MKHFPAFLLLFTAVSAAAQPAWQQRVDTKIDVTLNDKHHTLSAFEEITYTNNSPDTLQFIYIHLWPNGYRNDRTPFERQMAQNNNKTFYFSKAKDKGYIDSLQFIIDGQSADHYSSDNAQDITRIDLPKPLLPHHSMKISTPFKVKIPKVFSRMGHTGQAYYISQWFPKPAVYDQKGWHPFSYLDQGEFYSEYGSYDVSITLPENYVVMATGNCTDEKENEWLDELAKKPVDTQRHKRVPLRRADSAVASSSQLKTIHFHEDNVHDFAWFADKRWIVRKMVIPADSLSPSSNDHPVTAWAAFLPSYAKQWAWANTYLYQTVRYYGRHVGPYQYKTIKAVEGDLKAGSGMEYPTVTVLDKTASAALPVTVRHEAGHNWFYGMLGSNERDHAWMDEGINTFYEQQTTRWMRHDSSTARKKGLDENLVYFERAANRTDQAIEQTSANFEKLNYGLDIYYKTALGLNWLQKYMGPADFEAGMHDYYQHWYFHHPYPEDFKTCMQQHTTKSIDWFFSSMLTTDKKIDFKITKARTDGDKTDVTIRNKTGVNSPVLVDAVEHGSITATAWSEPFTGKTTITIPTTDWNRLKIDDVIPDGKPQNDVYRRNAIIHDFGVEVRPLAGLNLDHKDKLFVSPAVGYNQYDGIMAGLLFHDLTIPENRFRFALAPMYSAETQSFVGAGSVGYVWYPENLFKEIMLQADGKTFHYNETQTYYPISPNTTLYARYMKVAPSLSFTFNEHNALSTVKRTLMFKAYFINEDIFDSTFISHQSFSGMETNTEQHTYGLVNYHHQNFRAYNPFGYNLQVHGNGDFVKLTAEGSIRMDYNKPGLALYARGFLGKFFAITNTSDVINRYELNASYNGQDDYLYDGTYLGRNAYNDFASQQISQQEGGFKVQVFNNAARSDNWMATTNIKTDLPFKYHVRLFLDAGLMPNNAPTVAHPSATTLLYDGGVELPIVNNFISIYIPIIMSDDFQNYLTNTFGRKNAFLHGISFTMQLQNANWLNAPTRVLKIGTGG